MKLALRMQQAPGSGATSNRILILMGLALVILIGLGASLIIVPNYRQAAVIRRQIGELQTKAGDMEGQRRTVRALEHELASVRERVDNELKTIPENPDLAALIRRLSQDVDRKRVLDQTFTAGSPTEAIIGGKAPTQAMPLTVDMEATFDSVFALLRNAESMNRLVRVSSVRVMCKRDDKKPVDPPIVKASVGLEAVFELPGSDSIVNVAGVQSSGSSPTDVEDK